MVTNIRTCHCTVVDAPDALAAQPREGAEARAVPGAVPVAGEGSMDRAA